MKRKKDKKFFVCAIAILLTVSIEAETVSGAFAYAAPISEKWTDCMEEEDTKEEIPVESIDETEENTDPADEMQESTELPDETEESTDAADETEETKEDTEQTGETEAEDKDSENDTSEEDTESTEISEEDCSMEISDSEDDILDADLELEILLKEKDISYAEIAKENPEKIKIIKGDLWVAGFEEDSLVYTGSRIVQNIRVYDRTVLLKQGTDYRLTYKNNTAAKRYSETGSPNVTITLIGQYTGSRDFSYSILPADIAGASVSDPEKAINYTGKKQEINPKIVYEKKTLVKDTHYKVTYSGDTTGSPEGISKVDYRVEGINNFQGVYEGRYYIVGSNYNLSKATVSVKSNVKYCGEEITKEQLEISVKIRGKIVDPINYNVELQNFDNAGTGTIIISPSETGKEIYAGKYIKSYKIVGGMNFKNTVTVDDTVWRSSVMYNKTICDGDGLKQDAVGLLKDGDRILTEGTDYTVKYTGNKKAGTARVTFTGLGRYNGTFSKTFKIVPDTELNVFVPTEVVYAKGGAVPSVEVRDRDGLVLKANTDYTVRFSNNKKCGVASYKITGKGNYAKTTVKEGIFNVMPSDLGINASIQVLDKTYQKRANAYKSTPVLYDKLNGKKLVAGTDYEKTISYQKKQDGVYVDISPNEILPVGTIVKVTVNGKGNYIGLQSATYKIYDGTKDIKNLYVKIDPQIYTAEEIKPQPADGKGNGSIHLYQSKSDMNNDVNEMNATVCVEVVSYANNIKVGSSASVTLRAFGEYGGQKTYKFRITPKSAVLIGVSSVILNESCFNMRSGDTGQLAADVLPVDADEWSVEWSSEDPSIAEVDMNGLVTAVGQGTTSILAVVTDVKGNKVTKSCKVFVDTKVIVVEAQTGDGQDDTNSFNTAIDQASAKNDGTIVWVGAGVYHVDVDNDKRIQLKSNVTMMMDDDAVIQALPTSHSDYKMIWITGANQVQLIGGQIIGDRKNHQGTSGEGGHCITIYGSQDVIIDGVDVSYGWGDGIYVSSYNKTDQNNNITIKNCNVHHNRRNNIALTSGVYVRIANCTLSAHGQNEGLCIETNYNDVPVKEVDVIDCIIGGGAKETMGVVRPAVNVRVTNCRFMGAVYNGACTGLEFKGCTIEGDLIEVNHANFSTFSYAKLTDTTIRGTHIK